MLFTCKGAQAALAASTMLAGTAVAVPASVDANGLQPTVAADLPPHLVALMRTNLNVQELPVQALLVDDADLAARRATWQPDPPHYTRGYAKLYVDHFLQAAKGADLDFLVGKDTRPITRESQ